MNLYKNSRRLWWDRICKIMCIYSNNKCMCVFLISPVPIAEPLTSALIDTPVFHNLAPRPIKYRVSVPIPSPNPGLYQQPNKIWPELKSWLLILMASKQKQDLNDNIVLLMTINFHTFSPTHLPQCQIKLAISIFLNKKSPVLSATNSRPQKYFRPYVICYLHIYKLKLTRSIGF